MTASVIGRGEQCRLAGWADQDVANRFLDHLTGRAFAAATVRAYAYDVLSFARFCQTRALRLADVAPVDLFEWVAWQMQGSRPRSGSVVALVRACRGGAGVGEPAGRRGPRSVRVSGDVRRSGRQPGAGASPGQGLRAKSRGVLGHLGPGRPRSGGRLVRSPRRLPESLGP